MNVRRALASGVISLTGVALFVPNAVRLAFWNEPPVGVLLALLGSAMALGLVAAGYWVYSKGFTTVNTVRIAVWNLLGVVVLGLVLLLVFVYQGVAAPAFLVANILAVSAVAHVIIGVQDVRRIRAEELAEEREKTAVLNRVLRHNLRTDAQVLMGNAEMLASQIDDPDVEDAATTIRETASDIGEINDRIKHVNEAIGGGNAGSVNLRRLVEGIAEETRSDYPEAEITVDVPEVGVVADSHLGRAVEELVENAVEHNADDVAVRITAVSEGGTVEVRVTDDGDGIPEEERGIVTGDGEITQLEHGSGLGLWVAKWIVGSYGGELRFPDETTAALRLRRG